MLQWVMLYAHNELCFVHKEIMFVKSNWYQTGTVWLSVFCKFKQNHPTLRNLTLNTHTIYVLGKAENSIS